MHALLNNTVSFLQPEKERQHSVIKSLVQFLPLLYMTQLLQSDWCMIAIFSLRNRSFNY
jgi:hypothetical protein